MGIPVEILLNIFDRFYRPAPDRSNPGGSSTGSGLEIAISQAIAHSHQS